MFPLLFPPSISWEREAVRDKVTRDKGGWACLVIAVIYDQAVRRVVLKHSDGSWPTAKFIIRNKKRSQVFIRVRCF